MRGKQNRANRFGDRPIQKKALGQVFLKSKWPVVKMVAQLKRSGVERVLEIGPGDGALTEELLRNGLRVTAIEKDERFVERLIDRKGKEYKDFPGNLDVQNEDILKFDLEGWIKESNAKAAIVGNIPYNISSPILMWGLPFLSEVVLIMFLVQKEFAERIAAESGGKEYGSLSVYCQLRAETKLEFIVGKEEFIPVPKVDSAVVVLSRKEDVPNDKQLRHLEVITRATFSQRRKKLRNSIKPFIGSKPEDQCPIDLDRRPETLTPQEFIELYLPGLNGNSL